MNDDPVSEFSLIPGRSLGNTSPPSVVSVKGELPTLDYPFTFPQLYEATDAKSVVGCLDEVVRLFALIDREIGTAVGDAHRPRVASTGDVEQAHASLGWLLDPRTSLPASPAVGTPWSISTQPFSLRHGPITVHLDVLLWVDTNMKMMVERCGKTIGLSSPRITKVVEAALQVYATLLKSDDYFVVAEMSTNYCTFLQDRIVRLIFGHAALTDALDLDRTGRLSNEIAFEVLREMDPRDDLDLIELGVWAGVMWSSSQDVQDQFRSSAKATIREQAETLDDIDRVWGVDHRRRFLDDVGADGTRTWAVVLDDNGESVFDLALFQRLLNDHLDLRLVFLTNAFPISTNLSLHTLETLLQHSYFSSLQRARASGRLRVIAESQAFRSFEVDLLGPESRACLTEAAGVYVKGQAFFETFQPLDAPRYYAFCVSSRTASFLSGCEVGQGVFAKVDRQRAGFTLASSVDSLVSLADQQ